MIFRDRRRYYIVDSRVQYKFFAIVVVYIVFIVFLLGFLMFIPSILGLSEEAAFERQVIAAQEFLFLHKRFWPSVLCIAIILGIHSIFIFHHVFGPLYRFKHAFARISEGDLSFNIKLRKADYLKEEQNLINNMINSVRETIGSIKRDYRIHQERHMVFFEAITQLDLDLTNEDVTLEAVRNQIKEIREKEEKLRSGFDAIKINNS